jgi:hypothetical protein
MLKLSLTFAFLFCVSLCFGQSSHHLKKDISGNTKQPIWVYKIPQQAPYFCTIYQGILTTDIDSIRIIKKTKSVSLYGKKAKNGAIVLYLKPDVVLIDLDKLLSAHNIPVTEQRLPLFVDSAFTINRLDLYFNPNAVKTVVINTEKKTGMKYISIKTKLGRRDYD